MDKQSLQKLITPTLDLVLPTRYKLRQHLTPLSTDSVVTAGMTRRLSHQMEKYFVVTDMHTAATLLDPRLKSKEGLMSEELKQGAIKALHKLLQSHTPYPISKELEVQPPPRKAARLDVAAATSADFFDDLFAPPQLSTSSGTTEDEVHAYLSSTSGEVVTNILQFWKDK